MSNWDKLWDAGLKAAGLRDTGSDFSSLSTDEKLDKLYAQQTADSEQGFVPSSKKRRVNLSQRTNTQRIARAQNTKALGFAMPEIREAAVRVSQSSNPIVRDAIRRAGGRSPAGVRIKLDTSSIPAPSPRSRPKKRRV